MSDHEPRSPGQWKPGQSGNPKGRPPGSPDKRGKFRRAIQEHGDELVKIVLRSALAGDPQALKLCLERIAPPLRPSAEPIHVDIPTHATAHEQAAAVLGAIARGEVDPVNGKLLVDIIGTVSTLSELPAILARLDALESRGHIIEHASGDSDS
ncbi:hypothetical protein JCM19379_22800 [Methyloparacoccus murrellii]